MKPVIVKPFPYGRNESIALHDVGALTCGHGDGALTRGHCVGRAIAPHDCSGPQSLSFAEGCHRGLQGWARATCGMRLIGEMADLHPRDGECFTMYGGGWHVIVSANYASRGVAKIGKTTIPTRSVGWFTSTGCRVVFNGSAFPTKERELILLAETAIGQWDSLIKAPFRRKRES